LLELFHVCYKVIGAQTGATQRGITGRFDVQLGVTTHSEHESTPFEHESTPFEHESTPLGA
jgi:hypothetical protein